MERVEFYVADLQALRFILIAGGLLLFAWWMGQLNVERRDKAKPAAFCKVGLQPEPTCTHCHPIEPPDDPAL